MWPCHGGPLLMPHAQWCHFLSGFEPPFPGFSVPNQLKYICCNTVGQKWRHGAIVDISVFPWSPSPMQPRLNPTHSAVRNVCYCSLPTSFILSVCLFFPLPLSITANAAGSSQTRHEREAGPVQSTPSSRSLPGVSVHSWPSKTHVLLHRLVACPSDHSKWLQSILKDKFVKTLILSYFQHFCLYLEFIAALINNSLLVPPL